MLTLVATHVSAVLAGLASGLLLWGLSQRRREKRERQTLPDSIDILSRAAHMAAQEHGARGPWSIAVRYDGRDETAISLQSGSTAAELSAIGRN